MGATAVKCRLALVRAIGIAVGSAALTIAAVLSVGGPAQAGPQPALQAGPVVSTPATTTPNTTKKARHVTAAATTKPLLRVWEWRRLDLTPLPTLTAGFGKFRAMGGTTVSLDISYVVDISEIGNSAARKAADAAYRTALTKYVAAAAGQGLRVEALAGSPHWIGPEVRYVTGIVGAFVTRFNRGSAHDLTGLHYDLEPWGTPEWSTDAPALTQQLIATVAQIAGQQAAQPAGSRVPVVIDMPFWLDGTAPPKTVTVNSKTLSPTEHVMRLLDNGTGLPNTVVVMAYRDQTAGTDGSLAVSAQEFALAKRYGGRVKVSVGQEIGDATPARITFFQEGLAALQAATKTLTATYGTHVAWGGLAVDDMASLTAAR